MPNHLYDSLFAPHAQKDCAFMHLPSGDVLSYAEFMNLAARVANVLVGLGLEVGDRLAVQVEKSEFALALYAACVQSGIVYLPLNTAYTAQELEYFVQNSGAKVLVCDASKADDLTPLSTKLGITLTTLDPSGTGRLQKAAANASEYFNPVERGPDDLAA
ncbi:MAG: AMP-binding protein, partial [Paracoccaceae bacterium]